MPQSMPSLTAVGGDARPRGPIVYPSEDDVSESLLHLDIRTLLRAIAQVWLASQERRALVLSDQFVYWVEGEPKKNLSPDLLVIPGADPDRTVTSWKCWEEDHQPTFAVEVVSDEIDKDYVDGPPKYDDIGVDELVIYDPLVPARGRTRRVRWQVYRRVDGVWSKVIETDEPAIESAVLGCWMREVRVGGQQRVRLTRDAAGEDWVPTPSEASAAEARAATQRAAQLEEAGRAAAERMRELEAEVARLRAALKATEPK